MHREEIIYEQGETLPSFGAPVFVTVLAPQGTAGRAVRESHVFLPGIALHLHEIAYLSRENVAAETAVADAARATHLLFAQYVSAGQAPTSGDRWRATGGLRYETRRLASHPFHGLSLQPAFLAELWDMQDWTASATLRGHLGQATGYKTDAAERRLLETLFARGQAHAC